jgi:cytoskeletal protein CcmA (bactofilin family)
MEAEKATVIDSAAEIEGKLHGKNVRILGRFKGEVELQGNLVLGEGSRVEATVMAESAEIAGDFDGDLVVKRLVLLEKARITGSVDAQALAVREGAVINGTVTAGEKRQPPPAKPQPKPQPKPEAKDEPKAAAPTPAPPPAGSETVPPGTENG